MLKFLVKLFAVFVFLLPFFLFAPNGPGPQPVNAADSCVLKIVSGAPQLGKPITLRLEQYIEFNNYDIELYRNNILISTRVIDPFNFGDPLEIIYPGGNFTIAGTYKFLGYRSRASIPGTRDICKENPPAFTLSGSIVPACKDGKDNDGDGKIDYAYNPAIHPDLSLIPISKYGDPGCSSWDDNDESDSALPECNDGLDNDGDGRIDFGGATGDPDCTSQSDNSEKDPSIASECRDGLDNDGDGKIDYAYDSTIHPDLSLIPISKYGDPGCESFSDNNEDNPVSLPLVIACRDGKDNDVDGKIDFGYDSTIHPDLSLIPISNYGDPGCTSWDDDSETDPGVPGKNPCSPTVCETALGSIPTTITGFAQSILNIAIGLAGGIALILMVIGAVRVLTSSGDQQRLAGGREMIIAALAGLLFLVFSVMILAFIGIDILKIPGLRRP